MFLNLSHHPSSSWSENQIQAALRMAESVVDFPFPTVPPEATLAEVQELAAICQGALPGGITHALVNGEYVLTFLLVRALQDKGVECYAATTKRQVIMEKDGTKTSLFEFVQFRPYPRLI